MNDVSGNKNSVKSVSNYTYVEFLIIAAEITCIHVKESRVNNVENWKIFEYNKMLENRTLMEKSDSRTSEYIAVHNNPFRIFAINFRFIKHTKQIFA